MLSRNRRPMRPMRAPEYESDQYDPAPSDDAFSASGHPDRLLAERGRSAGRDTVASQQGIYRGQVELDSIAPREIGQRDQIQVVALGRERRELLEEMLEAAWRNHLEEPDRFTA